MTNQTQVDLVEERRTQISQTEDNRTKALRDAENMADQFSDVRVETYSIPIERFLGLPVFQERTPSDEVLTELFHKDVITGTENRYTKTAAHHAKWEELKILQKSSNSLVR